MSTSDQGLRRSKFFTNEELDRLAVDTAARQASLRREGVAGMSQTGKAFRMGLQNLRALPPAVTSLTAGLIGDEERAMRDADTALAIQQQATAEGPDIQNADQVKGVGDALAYARNLGISQVPNIAMMVATGGIGAGVRGGVAVAAREGLARTVASRVAADAVRRRGVGEVTREATEALATKALRRIAPLNTARIAKQGQAIGGALGGTGLQIGQIAPTVISDDTTGASAQERAGKALVGSLATGSLEAFPVMALFKRFGLAGKVTRDLNKSGVVTRIAKAAAGQAGKEGGTELVQTLGERATHKWVNDNVEMMSEEALGEYFNAFVGGAVAGGLFGAPAGLRGGGKKADGPSFLERARAKVRDLSKRSEPVAVDGGASTLSDVEGQLDANTQVLNDEDEFNASLGEFERVKPFETKLDPVTGEALVSSESSQLKGMWDVDGMKALVAQGIPKRKALVLSLLDPELAGELHATKPDTVDSAADYVLGQDLDEPGMERAASFLRMAPAKLRAKLVAVREWSDSLPKDAEGEPLFTTTSGKDAANKPVDTGTKRPFENMGEFTSERTATEDAELNDLGLLKPSDINDASMENTEAVAPGRFVYENDKGAKRQMNLLGLVGKTLADPQFGSSLGKTDNERVVNAMVSTIFQLRKAGVKPLIGTLQPGFMVGKTEITPAMLQEVKRGLMAKPRGPMSPASRTIPTPLEALVGQATAELEPRSAPQTGSFGSAERTQDDTRAPEISDRDDPSTLPVPLKSRPNTETRLTTRGDLDAPMRGIRSARKSAMETAQATLGETFDAQGKEDSSAFITRALEAANPKQRAVLKARLTKYKALVAAQNRDVKSGRGASLTEGQTIVSGSVDTDAQFQEAMNEERSGAVDKGVPTGHAKPLAIKASKPARETKAKTGKAEPKAASRKVAASPSVSDKELRQIVRTNRAEAKRLRAQTGLTEAQYKVSKALAEAAAFKARAAATTLLKRAAVAKTKRGVTNTKRGLLRAKDVVIADPKQATAKSKKDPLILLDKDIDDVADGDGTDPDNEIGAMQRLVDALSAKLGLGKVTVEAMTLNGTSHGSYTPETRTIQMNLRSKRTGAARIETLLHELGHHIYETKWKDASTDVRSAVWDDFQAWLKARGKNETTTGLRASRAPASIAELMLSNTKSADMAALSPEDYAYMRSIEEYVADQLARAMSSTPDTQTVVGKFFKDIADTLKAMYEFVVGGKPHYAPAPSAALWVQQLLQQNRPAPTQLVTPSDFTTMLNPQERGILEATFSEADIEAKIRKALPPAMQAQLDSYATRMETLVNAGIAMWLDGKLIVNPKQRGVIRRVLQFMAQALGFTTRQNLARVILHDFKAGVVQRDPKRYNAKRRARERIPVGTIRRNIADGAAATDKFFNTRVRPVYNRLLESVGTRIRASNIPALRQLVARIDLASGEQGPEAMAQDIFRNRSAFISSLMTITEKLTPKQKIALRIAMQRRKPPKDPKLDDAWAALTQLLNKAHAHASTRGVAMGKIASYFPVMMDSLNVGAREDVLRGLYTKYLPQIKAMLKKRKIAFTDDADALNLMIKAAKGDARSLEGEQILFSDGEVSPGFKHRRPRLSKFIYDGGDAADIKLFQSFQEKSLDKIMVNYIDHLVKRSAFVKRFPITKTKNADGDMESTSELTRLLDLAKSQGATDADIQLAKDYVDASLGAYNKRVSPVLMKLFGAIDGMLGTNLKDVDFNKFTSVQVAIATYQNLRLLGLASLSSLIDPIGTYVRVSDAKIAFSSFRAAMGSMGKNNASDLRHMAEMLGVIERGALSELLAYANGTNADSTGWAAKINTAMFKWNGLESITRFSRLMALSAGHLFLLKHAHNPTEHSARYLREMNIDAKQIIRDPNNPNFVVINEATRDALYRFVDDAVVRPRSQQRPLWHSDPNFALVSQYKGYLYSFYNTVIQRAVVEVKNGNFGVAAPLAMYIPITMLAEAAREMVQFGFDGDEKRDNWSLWEYMSFVMGRTGMLGPKVSSFSDARVDLTRGSTFANSFIGPTAQQLGDLVETAVGSRGVKTTLIDSIPGSAIFEDHLRGLGNDDEHGQNTKQAAKQTD